MIEKMEIRVAKILEVYKIVINRGKNDYIDEHMEFLVYDEGEEILDPVSGKSLGVLENPKGAFKAIHIQDNMSILLSKTKRPSKLTASFATLAGEVDAERDLLSNIKVGDKVKITNQIT